MTNVRLGDIVKRIKDPVDKDNTDLIYYVGGEHFDNAKLTVTKKGIIKGSTIGPAFSTKFKAGDVLLMSRNPHLRKAGLVNFEGICSDVSYIIRTKDENVILQKFIPILFQSDIFWDFAEKHKKGSTNFFLNWSDFEKFEFNLPDIETQRRLCELLWSINDTIDSYDNMINMSDELIKSRFIEMFGDPISNDYNWNTEKVKTVAPEYKALIPEENSYWWLNLDMVETFTGKIIDKVYCDKSQIGNSVNTFNSNVVLYSKLRPYLNKVVCPDGYGFCTSELVPLMPNERLIRKEFLFNIMRSEQFVEFAMRNSSGAQMPRMSLKILRDFDCILPELRLQDEFIQFANLIDKSKFENRKGGKDLCRHLMKTIQ